MVDAGVDFIEGDYRSLPRTVERDFWHVGKWMHVAINRREVIDEAKDWIRENGQGKLAERLGQIPDNINIFFDIEELKRFAVNEMGYEDKDVPIVDERFSYYAFAVRKAGDEKEMGLVLINVGKLIDETLKGKNEAEEMVELNRKIFKELVHELIHLAETADIYEEIIKTRKIFDRFSGVVAGAVIGLTAYLGDPEIQTLMQIATVGTITPVAGRFLAYLIRGGERVASEIGIREKPSENIRVEASKYRHRNIEVRNSRQKIVYEPKEVVVI